MNTIDTAKIKQLRKERNLSQKELAKKLGITDRAVSKWEMGLSEPSGKSLIALSKIFDVTIEEFLTQKKTFVQKRPLSGMESLTELYKIGRGPSSSHTIGPERACMLFKEKNAAADSFKAILYGSLAKTGKGHGTNTVIEKTFAPCKCDIEFDCTRADLPHPNTMELIAYKNNIVTDQVRVLSVGGGSIAFENEEVKPPERIYALDKFCDIAAYCKKNNMRLYEYAIETEGANFEKYMATVWEAMKASVENGLNDEGILPGGLNVRKKAKLLFDSRHIDETAETKENRMVCAYAFAVGEQNASGEKIVTAPTCGAAGVVPAVLYYRQQKSGCSDKEIIRALMSAGIVGNVIKTNASISGAECGCQAEIGSACAMAAAALAELFELGTDKLEYAAEIAVEHHLGLTCDPICGLVQIPCIERNAVAAMRAINAVSLASFLWNTRKISFDKVVRAMKETGRDMNNSYKETSEAGLARIANSISD